MANTATTTQTATAVANTATPTRTATTVAGTATVTTTPTCSAGGGTPGPWAVVSPAPNNFYGGSGDGDGTFAYVAGGYSFTGSVNLDQFIRYNPVANTWTTLIPMPQAAAETGAVYSPINNKVYVFGGEDVNTGVNYNNTRIYDIAAGTWSAGAVLPDVRSFFAAAVYSGGKIYLVGGYNTGSVTSAQAQVWEYDPLANTFTTTRAPIPVAVGGSGYGVINGVIYVAGGRGAANTVLNTVYGYNIAANTWATLNPLPSANNVPGSAVVGGKLVLIGGGNPFLKSDSSTRSADAPQTTGATQIYDPATGAWTTGPTLNVARSFIAAAAVGNRLVAVGGYDGATTSNVTEMSIAPAVPCASVTVTATPVANTATTTQTQTAVANTATTTQTQTAVANTATTTATSVAATTTATSVGATTTATGVPANTSTATSVPVNTSTAVATATTTITPVATDTPCTIRFSDVTDPTTYYYQGVYYLACHGVISGYSDGTYRPFNNTTRGQMTKIVTLAFNIPLVTPPALDSRTFTDVLPDNVFYQLIETAAARNIVSGYTCGGVNSQTGVPEPCDSNRRPYFRPSNFVTRGQLTKIVVIGAGFTLLNPPTPTFTDVVPSNVFYQSIETAVCHGIITGYDDHTFRPNNYAFRGQIAKIVYLAATNPAGTCPAATPLAR